MKQILSIIAICFLASCKPNVHAEWKNEHIDRNVRQEIDKLNDIVFLSIRTQDPDILYGIATPDYRNVVPPAKMDTILMRTKDAIADAEIKPWDQWYSKNSTIQSVATVVSGMKDDDDYGISFVVRSGETFISLTRFKHPRSEVLVTTIYGKENDRWALYHLQVGLYSIANKTAVDYYHEAKALYEKGAILDAALKVNLVSQCAKPANELFTYRKDKEMKELCDKIMKDINSKYHFPIAVTEVKTAPHVYSISPQVLFSGTFPMITYISSISLEDTVALKKEGDELQIQLGKLFPGFNRNNDTVIYKAFNQSAIGNDSGRYYRFPVATSKV